MEIRKCDTDKPYVFVSYSSEDKELVHEDVKKLQQMGYNVWLDDANLDKTNPSWKLDALGAIEDMDCQLLMLYVSRHSLTSEPCLNELRKTKDKETMVYHDNASVPFIAVEVERIEDITKFQAEISGAIKKEEKLEKETKKEKIKVLSEFIEEFFNNNNERVRIHAKTSQKSEQEYFNEIIKCFPEATKNQDESEKINEGTDGKENDNDIKENDTLPNDKGTKPSSITGDITYSLYGEEYTENQSDMMLRFFAQVLKRHQEIVPELPEHKGMNCVSKTDYSKYDKKEDMPPYFRTCQYFTYENGTAICVGTSYGLADKLKKMALLLDIVGEDRDIFASEQVELPYVRVTGTKGGASTVNFEVFGENYSASQVDMLGIVFSKFIEKHQDCLEEIANACTCLDIVDYSRVDKEDRPVYFRSSLNIYEVNGVKYSVGGGFSMQEKLRLIGVLISICKETSDSVKIEGEPVEIKQVSTKKTKTEKSFL